MFFKNLTLFRFPSSLNKRIADIENQLGSKPLKPVGPLELSSRGFVSPFGRGEAALSHAVSQCTLVPLGGEDKLLRSAVVDAQLALQREAVTEAQGQRPGGAERKRIKEEVLTDLLPRGLARPSR